MRLFLGRLLLAEKLQSGRHTGRITGSERIDRPGLFANRSEVRRRGKRYDDVSRRAGPVIGVGESIIQRIPALHGDRIDIVKRVRRQTYAGVRPYAIRCTAGVERRACGQFIRVPFGICRARHDVEKSLGEGSRNAGVIFMIAGVGDRQVNLVAGGRENRNPGRSDSAVRIEENETDRSVLTGANNVDSPSVDGDLQKIE